MLRSDKTLIQPKTISESNLSESKFEVKHVMFQTWTFTEMKNDKISNKTTFDKEYVKMLLIMMIHNVCEFMI